MADRNPSEANFTAYMNEMRSLEICKSKNYKKVNDRTDELVMEMRDGEEAERIMRNSPNIAFISRRELQRRIAAGRKAKEQLIMANIRLVPALAKKYKNKGLGIDDLVQEGNCGLIHALEKYELGKGTKFTTYASQWIMQYMSRALQNQGRSIRIPVYIEAHIRAIQNAIQQFEHENNAEPSISDISAITGLEPDKVAEYMKYDKDTTATSLDAKIPNGDHGNNMTLADFILDKDDGNPGVSETVEQADASNALMNVIGNNLSATEQFVILNRYGLGGDGKEKTLEEVASSLGMTREGVRKVGLRAERKLKALLAETFSESEITEMIG